MIIMIKLKWPINPISFFLSGLLFGMLLVVVGQRFITVQSPIKTDDNEREMIAPYYQPSDLFKRIKTASSSATVKIPIVMYHYIEYVNDRNDFIRKQLDVAPDLFEKELKVLRANHFQTYFVKDIPDILNGEIEYEASRSAVLTFDDGYEDFYTVVYPLLKKYQAKGTVYIIANYIGRRGFLNEKQIKELISSHLVEIGSHTLNHLYLKTASSSAAEKEIAQSKINLESRFQIKVKTFAYPYGAFNDTIETMIKTASYSAAVSVMPGVMQSENDLFHLSRVRPGMFTASTIINVLNTINK